MIDLLIGLLYLLMSFVPFTTPWRQARCPHIHIDRGTDWTGFCERELDFCNDCGASF